MLFPCLFHCHLLNVCIWYRTRQQGSSNVNWSFSGGHFADPPKSRLEQRRVLIRWWGPKIVPTADWTSLWPTNVAWTIVWVPIGIMAASKVF